MNKEPLRIAVFASHGGSNLQALIDGCESGVIGGEIVLVISNNRKAFALERARRHRIDAIHLSGKQFPSAKDFEDALLNELGDHKVNLVCLAGYMKLLPTAIIRFVNGRVFNIHPALLPEFGGRGMYGMQVHEAVIAAKVAESGATVHMVDEAYDRGKIIAQQKIKVLPDDTPKSLQQRVLEIEHKLYPETIARIASGEIELE